MNLNEVVGVIEESRLDSAQSLMPLRLVGSGFVSLSFPQASH
jgi:hypothetical protein